MPVNPSVEGRSYPPTPPYVVSRVKIAELATALQSTESAHTDVEVARERGHADVVAPPTFLVGLTQQAEAAAILDPEAEVDFSRLVHGEQSFTHHRPVVAGDELVAACTVDRVRQAGGHSMLTLRTEVTDTEGAPVCTTTSLMVIRGGE